MKNYYCKKLLKYLINFVEEIEMLVLRNSFEFLKRILNIIANKRIKKFWFFLRDKERSKGLNFLGGNQTPKVFQDIWWKNNHLLKAF